LGNTLNKPRPPNTARTEKPNAALKPRQPRTEKPNKALKPKQARTQSQAMHVASMYREAKLRSSPRHKRQQKPQSQATTEQASTKVGACHRVTTQAQNRRPQAATSNAKLRGAPRSMTLSEATKPDSYKSYKPP